MIERVTKRAAWKNNRTIIVLLFFKGEMEGRLFIVFLFYILPLPPTPRVMTSQLVLGTASYMIERASITSQRRKKNSLCSV